MAVPTPPAAGYSNVPGNEPLRAESGSRVIRTAGPREDPRMFGIFGKDPAAKLRKEYEKVMAQAIELQRKGDIRGFAAKSDEAARLEARLDELQGKGAGS